MDDTRRADVVMALSELLAGSYTLYLKTHNYHWNVTGPMFTTLHTLFETQYTDLALAVDEIAERIRTLGAHAPGSWAEFGAVASIKEAEAGTSALDMVRNLVADQAAVVDAALVVDGDDVDPPAGAQGELGERRAAVRPQGS